MCGSSLPAVRVEGRRNDVLVFHHAGRRVSLAPMGLITLLGTVPGIRMGTQYVQTDARTLSLRIAFLPGTDESRAWAAVERRLRAHLRAHGLPEVDVVRSPNPPERDPRTGKLLRIWSEVGIPIGSTT
jgi:hypothetical protein